MTTNKRNNELLEMLKGTFVPRNDPGLALSRATSLHLAMPRVTGFWPGVIGGTILSTPTLTDITGNGQTMTPTSTATSYYLGAIPVLHISSNTAYFSTPDAGVNSFGDFYFFGWVRFTSLGATQGIINKWGVAGNKSFRVYKNSGNVIIFEVSGDGTAVVTLTHSTVIVANQWYRICANFISSTPGGLMRLFVDQDVVEDLVNPPVVLFDNTTTMQLGRATNASNDGLLGYLAFPLVGASDLPDTQIKIQYAYTRWLFGSS